MSSDPDRLSRLADALLVAEAAYQRARECHDRERSPLSQRVLIEARHRLEFLEGQMFTLREEPPDRVGACRACGGTPRLERWSATTNGRTIALIGDSAVPVVTPLPEWAAPYALRGTASVSRWTCSRCGTEIAVVTGSGD